MLLFYSCTKDLVTCLITGCDIEKSKYDSRNKHVCGQLILLPSKGIFKFKGTNSEASRRRFWASDEMTFSEVPSPGTLKENHGQDQQQQSQ